MIEFRIKEKTRSLNESFRGDWRPRAAAAKRQRSKAMQACPKWPGGPLLVVRLTRVSPGTLDGDAVPAALKHIRDGVASRLRIDDASPLVEWVYHQAKGEAEVVVQIWRDGEDSPPLPVGRPVEMKRGKVLATVKAEDPRSAHAEAERMKGGPLRVRCAKNGCRRMLPCPDHSHHLLRPAYETPRKPRKVSFNDAMDALVPERRASNPPPMGMGHGVDRSDRMTPAEERKVASALRAAREADATFAPAPVNRCHAGRDGECNWRECPQEANNRANYNNAGCPLWVESDAE